MSVAIDIDVKLQGKADKLKKSVILKVLENAALKTALDTEKELKKTAPVDTGNLRRSIAAHNKSLSGFVIKGAYYWVYLNFGTGKILANPFVTEAASGIPADYKKNLKEQLQSVGLE